MPRAKSPSPGIGRPLTELRAVVDRGDAKIDALVEASKATLAATTALTGAVKALVEANTPRPVVGMGPTFDNGQARHATMTASSRAYTDAVARSVASAPVHDAFLASLDVSDGVPRGTELTDEELWARAGKTSVVPVVPRGTEPEPAPAFDPMSDMAQELAEMAAEDDEPPPPPDEWEVWERRLTLFRGQRMWLPDWGPLPGQDGCLVPYEMLNGGHR